MSFPPLHPPSQSSLTSSDSKPSSAASARPRQSAWGLPAQSGSRRGLTPLTTNVPTSTDYSSSPRRPDSSTTSSSNNTAASPFAPSFSSVVNSSSRLLNSRNTPTAVGSSSSSALSFTPLQAGSQQQTPSSQPLLSPRSRATTPFSTSNLASSAASSATASQGGGGGSSGGGGPSRPAAFSPSLTSHGVTSPTAPSFDRTAFGLPNYSSTSNQSSVSKIVVTQVFLLLNSISEKEGKAKWESKAEDIRKLVYTHGMDVFAKYFRRLLVGNAAQIFPGTNRSVENPGNYPLLVQEVEKASKDYDQARNVAEIVDTSEGDIFRDFDLATFLNHFRLDSIGRTILAAAFTRVNKADLRAKASTILSNTFLNLIEAFANTDSTDTDIPESLLATAALRILQDLPESSRSGSERYEVKIAMESRYSKQGSPVPPIVRSALALDAVLNSCGDLSREIIDKGPASTGSVENIKEILRQIGKANLGEYEIAGALLCMILALDADRYSPVVFVTAVRETLAGAIDWSTVIRGFDREGLVITQAQFLSLYNTLLPLSHEGSTFDIQSLWGGQWQHVDTQLSFAISLVSLSSSQLDITTIPQLRRSYNPRECLDGDEEVTSMIENATKDPMISSDAVAVIAEVLWNEAFPIPPTELAHARSVISEKMTFFLCSAAGLPKPWAEHQHAFFVKMVGNCLMRQQPDYRFILHSLWKQDKHWLAQRLAETHSEDPIKLPMLLEHAQEHDWLEDLFTMMSGFGIDLAAYAHRKGLVNIHDWAQDKLQRGSFELTTALSKFLLIKAQDEMRTVRLEQPAPRTVSLAMKTVHAMLEILEEHMKDRREELNHLERQCMQAFPRLCNYGEGHDEVIETNGAETNTLPTSSDAEMQRYYKRMYSGELEVRHIIEGLRDCKIADDPRKQDLFACMIHGLFDEFVCFSEYPLGPLATTAVLFGGIINYRLINNFALNVALEMVLESVRDYSPETPMYKFGLQALLHFLNRFPEWPDFCQHLVQIPGLQGTEAYTRAQEGLREQRSNGTHDDADGVGAMTSGQKLTNGDVDEFIGADSLVPQFRSVNVDPPPQNEIFEEPEEEVHDKVLFVLNNVSEQNLHAKISDLADALERKHHQWFASYLVEQRAKSQPNYQQLYLDLLDLLNDKQLWADVLRETFVSVRRVLNADSTMKSPTERTHLRNLGTWLGSLTIAKDKPIKHKNISFKELLIEGWETSRLILVIPFTCEVLAQGAKSIVFKPPNPWVMEVIGLLLELYDLPDLKIQQKFAVEVLLGTFGLPRNGEGIERSTELKKRQQIFGGDVGESLLSDGMEPFEDMSISGLHKGLRVTRFEPPELPDLEGSIVLPPASSSPINQAQLRRIVLHAVQSSITEIIGPAVERSVTIATIATKDLINKDFAQEGDEDRVREAFEQMARSLSGSLASVTCKEPLRMSMGNYIRLGAAEITEPLPEGSILMCVNDNLEMACKIVEKQAEERALPEIEPHLEIEIAKRRQHKAERPNEPFRDPAASHWSTFIPDPYKQTPGGLNQQQLDIYQHFAPQARGTTSHTTTASTDSGKQIPDVLQDSSFANLPIPNFSTPAEPPALPHQTPQQPPQNRLVPPSTSSARPPAQVNGFLDGPTLQDHVQESISELARLTKESSEQQFKDLARDNPIVEVLTRIVNLVRSSSELDSISIHSAALICPQLYADDMSKLEIEVLAQLLKQMCIISGITASKVTLHFQQMGDDKIMNSQVTASLLEAGLMEFGPVDLALGRALSDRKTEALQTLSDLLDALLFGKDPMALRADFACSLGEMGQWLSVDPNLVPAKSLMARLKAAGMPESPVSDLDPATRTKQLQMQYVFTEWLELSNHPEPSESMLVAFISQLHYQQTLCAPEDLMIFLRHAIDMAVRSLERVDVDPSVDSQEAYFNIDALAKLVILLVKTQGENMASSNSSKSAYMKSILSLIALVLNKHQVMRGEQLNQRAFFRLFSDMFHDWHDLVRGTNQHDDRAMVRVFGEALLALEPANVPGFTHGWLSLVSHRVFMPAILKFADKEGSDLFTKIMEVMITFVSDLLKPSNNGPVAKELYRGVLRVLLILHHDFPEFLAENHFRLCNIIPLRCTQLRNLVLSAFPSSILELPDPFSQGLKVDRLDDMRKAPTIANDVLAPLRQANIKDVIDGVLGNTNIPEETVHDICEIVYSRQHTSQGDLALLHAIVIYIGQTATFSASSGFGAAPAYANDSPQAMLLNGLAKELNPDARYHFLCVIVNQLRYPNSHTHFFSYVLLNLFGTDQADQQESDVRQQITRVLLERLIVHRPHPWGLIITLLELLKNPVYMFWDLPFIKAAPEITKLFDALFSYVQSSRTMG